MGEGSEAKRLAGLAFAIGPDDRECLMELEFSPGEASSFKLTIHYPSLDGTNEPHEVVGEWGATSYQIMRLSALWESYTKETEIMQRRSRRGKA